MPQCAGDAASWRRRGAHCDHWRVRGVGLDAARRLPFANEPRGLSRRAAIGADEHFIPVARHRAVPRQTIRSDNAQARGGRTLCALRPWGSRRAGRPWRTGSAGFAFRTWRTGRTWIAFRAGAAADEADCQGRNKHHIGDAHLDDDRHLSDTHFVSIGVREHQRIRTINPKARRSFRRPVAYDGAGVIAGWVPRVFAHRRAELLSTAPPTNRCHQRAAPAGDPSSIKEHINAAGVGDLLPDRNHLHHGHSREAYPYFYDVIDRPS